jgi:hypothetical protein
MSSEQFVTPNFEQPSQPTGTSFEHNDEINFRASSLESVKQARAALTAAMYAIPAGSLEVVNPSIEQQRLTPPQEAKQWSENVESIRTAYLNNNLDLSRDDELTQDMFGKAA